MTRSVPSRGLGPGNREVRPRPRASRSRATRRVAWLLALGGLFLLTPPARAADAGPDSLSLAPPRLRGWQSGAFRADRLEHASLAFSIGLGTGLLTRSETAAAGTALALGLGKEFTDDHFDRGDLLADAVGAALGALVVASLTR